MIQLTTQQRQAVHDGEPVCVLDADLGTEVVVVRGDLFDAIKDLLREEHDRQIMARIAMKNAIARANEPP